VAQNVLVNQILTWLSLGVWLKVTSFGRGVKHSDLHCQRDADDNATAAADETYVFKSAMGVMSPDLHNWGEASFLRKHTYYNYFE